MKKNKTLNMLLVGVLALLVLAGFAQAGVTVTGPTDGKIVVDVDYSVLNEDDDDTTTLTYTKTLTFTNTEPVCPVNCDVACETECTTCGQCVTTNCATECAIPGSENCNDCIVTKCIEECTPCGACITDCEECEETPVTVTLTAEVLSGYTAGLSDEEKTFNLAPGESKDVTLELTVPVTADAGSYDVGDLNWKVGEAAPSKIDIMTDVASMLELSYLKVFVDGSKEDTIEESGEKTSDIAPGSSVEFKFRADNVFDNDYNEGDLDVELTMKFADGVDEDDFGTDLDDLEEDWEEEFDLGAGEDMEDLIFALDVPGNAEEDTYELIVTLEATDGNGAEHNVKWSVFLNVDRKKNDVRIEKAYLQPETMVCGGEASLKVKLTNFGSNDQDDVALTIVNEALGLNVQEMDITLDKDPDDDDNSYTKTATIVVGEDLAAGTYTIEVKAYTDGDEEVDHQLVKLTVLECAEEAAEEVVEEESAEEEVIVQTLPSEMTAAGEEEAAKAMTGATVVETVETTQSKGTTAFMIVTIALLAVLIILMLAVLLKKR